LARENKQHLFGTVFNVAIGPAKQYLGADVLEEISEITVVEYGSLSLKVVK
jgi:hypothetical protein